MNCELGDMHIHTYIRVSKVLESSESGAVEGCQLASRLLYAVVLAAHFLIQLDLQLSHRLGRLEKC